MWAIPHTQSWLYSLTASRTISSVVVLPSRDIILAQEMGSKMSSQTRSWLAEVANAAVQDFVRISAVIGYEIDLDRIVIEVSPAPHKRGPLRAHHMGIYSFWWRLEALKVGLASPNNNARFRYHHYSPGTSGSNLALSLSRCFEEFAQSEEAVNYRSWIETEVDRIDFQMPAEWGQPIGRLMEAYLHARWRPRFEGRAWKGYHESLPAPPIGAKFEQAALSRSTT